MTVGNSGNYTGQIEVTMILAESTNFTIWAKAVLFHLLLIKV